jgi:hypothetical protein
MVRAKARNSLIGTFLFESRHALLQDRFVCALITRDIGAGVAVPVERARGLLR